MVLSPATNLNVASVLEHHARQRPARDALVCGGQRVTYAQLNHLSSQVANALRCSGVGVGDHVALSCPNIHLFPIVYYGILKAGGVVVPLNVLFKGREIGYHLRDSDAKFYCCFEGTPELPMSQFGKAGMDEAPGCQQMMVLTLRPETPSPIEGAPTFWSWIANQPTTFETVPVQANQTAVILYTSGTTGAPKGAELTHLNVTLNAIYSRELVLPEHDHRPDAENVHLVTLPLFHSFGQVCQLNAHIFGGTTLVLLPRFEPKAVLETMVRERVNFWAAVPTMYWALLQYAQTTNFDVRPVAEHLRLCISGGAPMPVEVMRRFQEIFGVRILEGYGLSETSPVATFNQLSRPSKPGTVGQPIPFVEVQCVDEEDRPVATGEVGEVVIRGHNIMKGYYKKPEATAEALKGGWFHSGDMGRLDEDGYLSIVDRKKDMILRGGFNVYPRELEELLMTHAGISLCAVIGVPCERLGEEIKAYVIPKPGVMLTSEEVITWCRQHVADYKYPRYVEFCDQLPMTATGKVLKRELRARGA